MANLKQYTYPVFMGISGFLTTVSDLIQKNDIAIFVAASLAAIGIITSVAPRSWLSRVRGIFSSSKEEKDNFSFRCLGVSCLLMAAAVFGFSTLSVKAAPEGGIIASQYPEIQQIQMRLGVLQETAKRIEDNTDKLLTATRQWISITDFRVWDGEPKKVHLRIENNTPFFFKNINGFIKTSDNRVIQFKDIGLGSDGIHYDNYDNGNSTPDRLLLCIIGERASDGAVIKETRTYYRGDQQNAGTDYILDDVTGPILINKNESCVI